MLAWAGLVIIVGSMVGIVIAFFFQGDDDLGDAGETEEERTERPSNLVIPSIADVTADWGLDSWMSVGADPLRGGATLHDLDDDGDLDLVVAGGTLGIYLWDGDAFVPGPAVDAGQPTASDEAAGKPDHGPVGRELAGRGRVGPDDPGLGLDASPSVAQVDRVESGDGLGVARFVECEEFGR